MPEEQRFEIRDLRNGDWFWIHRTVINEYTQKVGSVGVIVYSLLASMADGNQRCFPSQRYIADKLGYSRATVNRAMKRLEQYRLIRIEKRSRYHCVYHLLKVRCNSDETQMSHRGNSGVIYFDTNDNTMTRNINYIDSDNNCNKETGKQEFVPRTREELLALDLADSLNDRRGIALYLSYAKRFPESLLRGVLGGVKEIPQERIKKSRAALFNYLICKHAKDHKNHGD